MAPKSVKKEEAGDDTFLGYLGGPNHPQRIPCHSCKLRGNGILDPNSNWRLWNADIKVFRDATRDDDSEVFPSEDDKQRAKMDRQRKALIWFTIGENLRAEHLVDLGGRESSSNDVYKRIYEKVAPPGTPYEPPPPLLKRHFPEEAKEA